MEARVVIADDEPLARQLLTRLVQAQPGLSIAGVAGDGDEALRLIRATRPDLAFLDVRMPGRNGMEVVAELEAGSYRPYVVFVTAFDEYAAHAFDLEAIDYLVKPVARSRFLKAVQRARRAIRDRRITRGVANGTEPFPCSGDEPHVIVRHHDELVRIRESDIVWLEAASQYVRVHTQSERYLVAEPLVRFQQKLVSGNFLRVHRSAVVNAARVRRVLKRPNGLHELRLDNGASVPLSRSRRALVRGLLASCAEHRRHD